MKSIEPFKEPIYLCAPFLPDINKFKSKIDEIWESKWVTNNGTQLQILEKELLTRMQVKYLSLFNNGTTALMIACKSLNLTGEVITTPFTFPASVHALSWNNLTPVFCDIDPLTYNIDYTKIESLITSKTTAILGVHIFGIPCNVIEIKEIAQKYDLKVIYDAAHAFNVKLNDKDIFSFGDISMGSFHATKVFNTIEGGILCFNKKNLYQKAEYLKNFGISNENVIVDGINGKMNEVQAAVGLLNLEMLDLEIKKRAELYFLYKNLLKDIQGIDVINPDDEVLWNYQYMVIKIDEKIYGKSRNWLHDKLKKYNVCTKKYFHPLCSDYPHYKHLDSSNLKTANEIVHQLLVLPLYGELKNEQIEIICKLIKSNK